MWVGHSGRGEVECLGGTNLNNFIEESIEFFHIKEWMEMYLVVNALCLHSKPLFLSL